MHLPNEEPPRYTQEKNTSVETCLEGDVEGSPAQGLAHIDFLHVRYVYPFALPHSSNFTLSWNTYSVFVLVLKLLYLL